MTVKNMRPWLFPFTHWNWKAAAIAAVFRSIACIVALQHVQTHARQHFGIVEAVYVLLTAGFFSALQQQSLDVKPRKLAWLITVVLVPLTSLGADAFLHQQLDKVNAHALGIGALIFTLMSALFHWHVMQSGALLVGKNSNSFSSDMKQMPKLLLSFVMAPALYLRKWNTADAIEESDLELAA